MKNGGAGSVGELHRLNIRCVGKNFSAFPRGGIFNGNIRQDHIGIGRIPASDPVSDLQNEQFFPVRGGRFEPAVDIPPVAVPEAAAIRDSRSAVADPVMPEPAVAVFDLPIPQGIFHGGRHGAGTGRTDSAPKRIDGFIIEKIGLFRTDSIQILGIYGNTASSVGNSSGEFRFPGFTPVPTQGPPRCFAGSLFDFEFPALLFRQNRSCGESCARQTGPVPAGGDVTIFVAAFWRAAIARSAAFAFPVWELRPICRP